MPYDINEIVSPKAIAGLNKLEQETAKVVANILKIHDASAKLDSTLAKIDGSKIKKLETATKEATKNNEGLAKSTVKLKSLQTDYMKTLTALAKQKEKATKKTAAQIKAEKDLEIVNSKTAGTLEKLAAKNRILRREIDKLDLDTEKGTALLKKKNAELDRNNKRIKDSADSLKKQKIGIGGYQEAIESSIPALRGMGGGIKAVSMQMKAMLANPVVLILAAIVGAFMALKSALTRSEDGQNRYNKLMEVLGAVLGKLMDIVTGLAVALFDAFSKPKQAVADLWKAIKNNIMVRIHSVIKLFGALQGIIKAALHLDVDGIKKNAKAAAGAFVDMNTGVENTIGKVKKAISDEGDAIKKSIKAAEKKADFEKEYNEQYRRNIKENAKLTAVYNNKMAEAENLKRTNGEKAIEALKAGFAAQKKIAENEAALAQTKLNMIKNESAEGLNTEEQNKKLAEAEANLTQKKAAMAAVEMQLARKLNFFKMEALKQDKAREQAKYDILKTEVDNEKRANADILNDTQVSLANKIQILADEWQKEQELIAEKYKVQKVALDSRLRLGLISQKDYDKQLKTLKAEQDSADEKLKKAHEDRVTQLTINSLKQRAADEVSIISETTQQELTELKKKFLAGEISQQEYEDEKDNIIYAAAQKRARIQIENLGKEIDAIKDNTEQKKALVKEYNDLVNQLDDQTTQHAIDNQKKRREAIAAALQKVMQLESGAMNLQRALSDRKVAKIKEAEKAEIAAAGDNAKKKKEIEDKYNRELAKIKRRQAITDKADALFKIAINTAVSAMEVAWNPWMLAFVISLGALSAAAVLAKPIPKYATGTKSAPGGLGVVGDAGPELIEQDGQLTIAEKPTLTYLKKGAKVFTNQETNQIFAQSGKDDYIVRDAIDRQTESIVETIRNKKEIHFNLRNGTIAEREGNYFKEYYSKKFEF